MAKSQDPFFVGWGAIPKELKLFVISCSVSFLFGFAALAYATSSTQTDTGSGQFMSRTTAVGVLRVDPYPVVHVIESEDYERGEVVLLSGGGKRGVLKRTSHLDGEIVMIGGNRLERGDLDGMQLRSGMRGLRISDNPDATFEIEVEQLGRWKLTGEICDGKCLSGAMRPGNGLAHKACANLCLIGEVPPVFVSAGPVDGHEFLLMADADGMRVTEQILDYTATYVEIEGDVERRGDMLVFKISPETIRLAQ